MGAAPTRNTTRQGWPVDRSLARLQPERLFRREPRFAFERGDGRRMSWRDLVLPERQLRPAERG